MGALLSGVATQGFANAPSRSLRPQARPLSVAQAAAPAPSELIRSIGLTGQTGFVVIDVASGEVLEAFNEALALPPASVAKVLTALYAWDRLGAQHRFKTRVVATAPLVNGVVKGDLILAGGGDATLDTDRLAELASQLKATGLRELRGRFLAYGGALPSIETIDGGQPPHVGYSPAISGLNLNYNRLFFEWKPEASGYSVTLDARGRKYRPQVQIASLALSDRKAPVYQYEKQAARDRWSVARGALGDGGGRWLPTRHPELYAGEVFASLARSHGIVLGQAERSASAPTGVVLASVESAPLNEILRGMLKYSTNLTAETVGLAASLSEGNWIGGLRGSTRVMNDWAMARLGMQDARLVDHSGLGDASRLSAGDLAGALAHAGRAATLLPMLKDIPLRQANGAPAKEHPITVRAKTGTLNFVSGLAGYMTPPDGRTLAFAIFSADLEARAGIARANRERPKGARSWNRRAKRLQQALIERWGDLSGS